MRPRSDEQTEWRGSEHAVHVRRISFHTIRATRFAPLPAARGEVGLRSNPGEGALPRF